MDTFTRRNQTSTFETRQRSTSAWNNNVPVQKRVVLSTDAQRILFWAAETGIEYDFEIFNLYEKIELYGTQSNHPILTLKIVSDQEIYVSSDNGYKTFRSNEFVTNYSTVCQYLTSRKFQQEVL